VHAVKLGVSPATAREAAYSFPFIPFRMVAIELVAKLSLFIHPEEKVSLSIP
jgi:hypothetical protein